VSVEVPQVVLNPDPLLRWEGFSSWKSILLRDMGSELARSVLESLALLLLRRSQSASPAPVPRPGSRAAAAPGQLSSGGLGTDGQTDGRALTRLRLALTYPGAAAEPPPRQPLANPR